MMFPNLFSPLKIGSVEVKNRISFQPHLTNFAVGNLPSERQMYYWGERAKGGAGLVITEELTVHPTDMAYEKLIDVYHSEVIPGFKKITDYVHQARLGIRSNVGLHAKVHLLAPLARMHLRVALVFFVLG